MLTKEEIQKEIEEMDAWVPVSKIEERLGMPPTTLQKVLTGKRTLPKKWHKVLKDYFVKDEVPKEIEKRVEIYSSPKGNAVPKKIPSLAEQLDMMINKKIN